MVVAAVALTSLAVSVSVAVAVAAMAPHTEYFLLVDQLVVDPVLDYHHPF